MPLSAESSEGLVALALITMVAACPSFIAIAGDPAMDRILLVDGGDLEGQDEEACAVSGVRFSTDLPFALVGRIQWAHEVVGAGVVMVHGSVQVLFGLPIPTGNPAEKALAAIDFAGKMRAELQAQIGSVGCLATGTVIPILHPIPAPGTADAVAGLFPLELEVRF